MTFTKPHTWKEPGCAPQPPALRSVPLAMTPQLLVKASSTRPELGSICPRGSCWLVPRAGCPLNGRELSRSPSTPPVLSAEKNSFQSVSHEPLSQPEDAKGLGFRCNNSWDFLQAPPIYGDVATVVSSGRTSSQCLASPCTQWGI